MAINALQSLANVDQEERQAIHRLSMSLAASDIGEADGNGNIPLNGIAYTGEPLYHPWWGTFVLDLAGGYANETVLFLWDHQIDEPIGMLKVAFGKDGIRIDGFADTFLLTQFDDGPKVEHMLKNKYPIQLSVYFDKYMDHRDGVEEVEPGETVTVNGHKVNGPALVFRKYEIREVSATPLGHDSKTSVSKLAAKFLGGAPVADTKTEPAAKDTGGDRLNAITEENKQLQAKLAKQEEAMKAQELAMKKAQEQINQMLAQERTARVNQLSTDAGITLTEDQSKAFAEMDPQALAAVESLVKAIKAKQPKLPEHLLHFENMGTDLPEGQPDELMQAAEARWGKPAAKGGA